MLSGFSSSEKMVMWWKERLIVLSFAFQLQTQILKKIGVNKNSLCTKTSPWVESKHDKLVVHGITSLSVVVRLSVVKITLLNPYRFSQCL